MAATCGSGRTGSAEKSSPVPHTRIEDERQIEKEYVMGRKLGQGSFGVVREVRHQRDNERWACKTINKEKAGSSAIKLLEREVTILKQVHHEHIIRLKEVFETSRKMYLIMELCEGGELADVIKDKGQFSEEDTRTIVGRLSSAISYLHKKAMVHRDIKLENILLSNNPKDTSDNLYIKVTDFGLSVVKGGASHENMMIDFCGTPMYMAPEIIENKTYSEKCDVWAMGVIVYTLLCGHPPFVSKDEEKLYTIIKSADVSKQFRFNPIWERITDGAKDCVCGMLTVDPAHRLTAHEVADHPWVKGEGQRAPNVLQMMKDWRNKLDDDDDRSTVCGDETVDMANTQEQLPTQNGASTTTRHTQPSIRHASPSETKQNNNNNQQLPRKYGGATQPPMAGGLRPGNNRTLLTTCTQRSTSKSPIDGTTTGDRVDGRRGLRLPTHGPVTTRPPGARVSNGASKDAKQIRARKS